MSSATRVVNQRRKTLADKWQATFQEMRKRAHLTEDEARAIRTYVEVDLVAAHAPTLAH